MMTLYRRSRFRVQDAVALLFAAFKDQIYKKPHKKIVFKLSICPSIRSNLSTRVGHERNEKRNILHDSCFPDTQISFLSFFFRKRWLTGTLSISDVHFLNFLRFYAPCSAWICTAVHANVGSNMFYLLTVPTHKHMRPGPVTLRVTKHNMKPTNPNVDTPAAMQPPKLFHFYRHTCGTPWPDMLAWHSGKTLLRDTVAWHFL